MLKITSINTKFYIIGIVIFCLYYLPMLVAGDGSYMIIHDNLDEDVRSIGYSLKNNEIHNVGYDQVLGGLPAEYVASPCNIINQLPVSMPLAYWINDLLMRIIAFSGMILLLRDHILSSNGRNKYILFLISILFAFIPAYTIYGLSVMGQPLLLWAFMNLWKGNYSGKNYVIIILFAFYSSLILSGVFICLFLGAWWIWGLISEKKFHTPFFLGIFLLGISYLIMEHQMIISTLLGNLTTHRIEWKILPESLFSMLRNTIYLALTSQYHIGSFSTIPIIIAFIGVIIWNRKIEKNSRLIFVMITGIILFYFINLLLLQWFSEVLYLKIFHWERFYFLLPMLWFLLFALLIQQILSKNGRGRIIFSILLIVFMIGGVFVKNKEFLYNGYLLLGKKIKEPTYKEFYAVDLFKEISDYIGKDKSSYRVVSLGIHPSIAVYNGFYNIDAYQNSYPLSYKHQFRRIIEPELNKNAEIKHYFDDWGSRCYLFSAELGLKGMCGKNSDKKIQNLDIDSQVLKELGAEYVFSAVEIMNAQNTGLVFEKRFTNSSSFWDIYLYKNN